MAHRKHHRPIFFLQPEGNANPKLKTYNDTIDELLAIIENLEGQLAAAKEENKTLKATPQQNVPKKKYARAPKQIDDGVYKKRYNDLLNLLVKKSYFK